NLHQIGIAAHNFHDSYGTLPPAWLGANTNSNGVNIDPDGWATWAVLLLPFVEQGPVYNLWNLRLLASLQTPAAYQTQVKTYLCAGSPTPVLSTGVFAPPGCALSDSAACFGTDADGANSNGAIIPVKNPVFTNTTSLASGDARGQLTLQHITDGTSNT